MIMELDEIRWLAQLKEAEERFKEKNQILTPKIQRVPLLLRQNKKFTKYCSPKLISLGPIHHNHNHNNESLKLGEDYKLLWTSKFVTKYHENINEDTNQVAQFLLKRIKDDIKELKNLFDEDTILLGWKSNDNYLAWMLFVDGCSLLYFMENIDMQHPEALNLELDQLMQMWRDMWLLENQLPRKLLEMLSKKKGGDLDDLFLNFCVLGESKRYGNVVVSIHNHKAIHILDYYRSILISPHNHMEVNTISPYQDEGNNEQHHDVGWYTYKNIRDLKRIGIQVKPPNSPRGNSIAWSNIRFNSKWNGGELRLPILMFNDVTPYIFRNLIAYEMCPDVHCRFECCSFFSFMDSLIDNAEDVKELRLSGVIQNMLRSDEDLANLINELGNDLPTNLFFDKFHSRAVTFSEKYIKVKTQIEKHYSNRWRRWLATGYNTYFSTPWSIIAFLAALLALVLSFLQTWFTIHPNK
ncbi:hypothetical protein JHK85_029968 [Glycine max]|nr:hypothetical protein JHK85_029968 [Glycine max]KAG5005295.1 hypothetical protein JHK86_029434 [Glycine max]KAH1140230.1 hypothetical protein GYH30_029232 [Glycine max]